jgi:hypothetical protein
MRWRRDIPHEEMSVSSMSMWTWSQLMLAGGDIARVLCMLFLVDLDPAVDIQVGFLNSCVEAMLSVGCRREIVI